MDKYLYSKPITEKYYDIIEERVKTNSFKLVIIIIGDREDSKVYVNIKKKKCSELGIDCIVLEYNDNIEEIIIINKIKYLNNDDSVTGIMVQLPLPKHLDKNKILYHIDEKKDVDGLHVNNIGKLMNNDIPTFYPCTPLAVTKIFEYYDINLEGKHVVFVGTGMVNLPLSIMLLNKKVESITLCNENTENIKEKTILADILIVACGQPKMIKKDWIKDNIIIIDIGINRDNNNKLCGDVDYEDVIDKVKYITPVPGGVGPMTVCMLINNLIKNI